MIHELKTYPKHFEKVISEEKKVEYRLNDRNYRVGDYLALNEYTEGEGYTGRSALFQITHILDSANSPAPLSEGYVILSITPCSFEKYNRFSGYGIALTPNVTSPFKEEETK